jgi:hypothetical protein
VQDASLVLPRVALGRDGGSKACCLEYDVHVRESRVAAEWWRVVR